MTHTHTHILAEDFESEEVLDDIKNLPKPRTLSRMNSSLTDRSSISEDPFPPDRDMHLHTAHNAAPKEEVWKGEAVGVDRDKRYPTHVISSCTLSHAMLRWNSVILWHRCLDT